METSHSYPYQRADQLLVKLNSRYQQFISRLPLPLSDFACQGQTYYGSETRGELAGPPASLRFSFLFWDIFKDVPDDLFLDIAEGGAYYFLASILLDHLVDGQVEDLGMLALLQQSFWIHGADQFRKSFLPDSPFWVDYNRLLDSHLRGLSAEKFAQDNPDTFTLGKTIEIAGSKICPALTSLVGLAHLTNSLPLLPGIEKLLKDFAAGTQFIDDVQDWRDDLAAGHLTHFLTCTAPSVCWTEYPWPTEEEIEIIINSSMLDLEHWQLGIDLFTQAIEGSHNLLCPGWTDYVFEERRKAQALWDQATAKHIIHSIESLDTTSAGDDKRISMTSSPPNNQSSPIFRAIEALLVAQRYDGAWIDFNIPGQGVSDTWVTAHIGLKLASLPEHLKDKELISALQSAVHFLDKKWRHGWGFNDFAPVDADSTSHALLFYHKLGIEPPPSTIPALLAFQRENGGFATYDKFRDSSMPESWCIAHPDVTPVVLRALILYQEDDHIAHAVSKAFQRIESDRLPDGTWPAFWWILRWYTTAAWMETWDVLRKFSPETGTFPEDNWEAADDASFGCVSTLDEALLLECAIYSGQSNIIARTKERVVEAQLPNGLWPVEPALCQTTPGVYHPWELDKRETLCPEESGIYSTASILLALALAEDHKAGA